MLQLLLAILAGILTVGAPCILPVLPILLGASIGQQSRTRPLFIAIGFIVTFAVLGLTLSAIVTRFMLPPDTLRDIAIIALAIFGLFLIWPAPFEKLTAKLSGAINRANKMGQQAGSGNKGGFVLGVMLGLIWTPCAGPILGAILTLIATQTDFTRAAILLSGYAIGAGIPMVLIAYGGQAITTKVRAIARYSKTIQQVFGILLIAMSAAMYFQYDLLLQAKLLEKYDFSGLEEKLLPTLEDKKNENGVEFKPLGRAPEFTGISNWLNSGPLTLENQHGKVVLVDFWTYSCINCIRTLPHLTEWHEKYKDLGLVIVGVHTPEFAFEKVTSNVQTALSRHNIKYPVAQDNDYNTWRAYSNRYWPAKYLINQEGRIIYTHFGEGKYEETENAIRTLLGLNGDMPESAQEFRPDVRTPEIYFGLSRLQAFSGPSNPSRLGQEYTQPKELAPNKFGLTGQWQFSDEYASLSGDEGTIELNFYSGKVFIVAEADKPVLVEVYLDGMLHKEITVTESQLYTLVDSASYEPHLLELRMSNTGLRVFTFTFG